MSDQTLSLLQTTKELGWGRQMGNSVEGAQSPTNYAPPARQLSPVRDMSRQPEQDRDSEMKQLTCTPSTHPQAVSPALSPLPDQQSAAALLLCLLPSLSLYGPSQAIAFENRIRVADLAYLHLCFLCTHSTSLLIQAHPGLGHTVLPPRNALIPCSLA